ncbi:MAG: hypothetical protein IPO21_16525 [Bacteroidales bacterium]|nr:hypothetical protein [Bacteroidales bacterium]
MQFYLLYVFLKYSKTFQDVSQIQKKEYCTNDGLEFSTQKYSINHIQPVH